MNIQNRFIFLLASFAMLAAIILDAMASHALSEVLDDRKQDIWATAGQYLLIQSLALIVLSLIKATAMFNIGLYMIAFGMLAFSLSLYTLCFIKIPYFGMITPIGGVSMLLGWLSIMIGSIKK